MQSATLRLPQPLRNARAHAGSLQRRRHHHQKQHRKRPRKYSAQPRPQPRAPVNTRALGPLIARLSAYQQQLVKYNFAVARDVLKHVYTAERLQPPTSLGAVARTYGTLWARARSLGYWREVVRSSGAESMLVLACTLLKRMGFLKLERLWGVGRSSAIMLSRVGIIP